MAFRFSIQLAAVTVLAASVTACSSTAQDKPSPGPTLAKAGASLPLQANVPPVGGDPQAPVRDLHTTHLTPDQLKALEKKCPPDAEISFSTCLRTALLIIVPGRGFPADEAGPCLAGQICISVVAPVDEQVGAIQIFDRRAVGSQCSSGPHGLCSQVPLDKVALVDVLSTLKSLTASQSSSDTSPQSGGPVSDTAPSDAVPSLSGVLSSPTATLPSSSDTGPASAPASTSP
jgi:hypothetical protein